ncbi:hypothetical protein EUX98_g9554 [Antrodiella citrinella]|uniref:CCHC-type domain-containing protein n=1 Tax=Antrodiella citrinella TaxID=2447956 RepID=A0A4S4LT88_9APHY|nr:hypothetical protein EUX98_g9554 [Antrodiella citrinella]
MGKDEFSITHLNGSNYHSWKDELTALLLFKDLWDVVDEPVPAETPSPSPAATAAATATATAADVKKDQKAWAIILFHVEKDLREPIAALRSGRAAWKFLKETYQKDTPTTRMSLRSQFYSLSHDPSAGVAKFIADLSSIVRRLKDIGHKPADDEITDKLLIGLHSSFASIRTTLANRTPSPSVTDITTALQDFEDAEKLQVLTTSAVGSNGLSTGDPSIFAVRGGGGRGGNSSREWYDDYDWGNTKGRGGVCFRCGRSGHVAQNCVAEMPDDVKHRILKHGEAHILTYPSISSGLPNDNAFFGLDPVGNPLPLPTTLVAHDLPPSFPYSPPASQSSACPSHGSHRPRGHNRGGRRGVTRTDIARRVLSQNPHWTGANVQSELWLASDEELVESDSDPW